MNKKRFNEAGAYLIKTTGEVTEIKPANGKDFSLEELQGYVDGLIEATQTEDGRTLIVNEEGKLNELDLNVTATELYNRPFDVIVGNAILINKEELFN